MADRADGQERGELGADDDVDLRRAGGEDAGTHLPSDRANRGRQARQAEAEIVAGAPRGEGDQQKLRHAGNRDRGGENVARRFAEIGKARHAGDHDQVQQDRGRGGGREPADAIQDGPEQSRQRHQRQVGKGEARHADRMLELLRVFQEAGRQCRDQRRHRDLGDCGQQHAAQHDGRQGFLRRAPRFDGAVPR